MVVNSTEYKYVMQQYQSNDEEILVLFSDTGGGAGRIKGAHLWTVSANFIAYKNLATGEISTEDGRIEWLLSDEDIKLHGSTYPFHFKKGGIYRLRVRSLIDKTVAEDKSPAFYNRFFVLDIIEENTLCDALSDILAEYRKPVLLQDELLGQFTLDKDYSHFSGKITWLNNNVFVHLNIDKANKSSWQAALGHLRYLYDHQQEKDSEFRQFAAEELTELANDWLDDEDADEITENSFAERMTLCELVIEADGDFTVYYSDDDMFYGHSIDVSGNIAYGATSANIVG
ncbi:DUF2262 domain-containing protein [Escherichia albertii]|uniref:DUF2262 domain-containing protein n=1 Tax=Escherichia albertii TaxID=208962 RepID=UPI0011F10A3D|nr:DUF2262 domain-containing protein [Escherichia albertii]